MGKVHKNERVLDRKECELKKRFSEFTPCYCNLGKDHEHFYSKEAFQRADITYRLECMQFGKPIPTDNNAVPYYYSALPMWVSEEPPKPRETSPHTNTNKGGMDYGNRRN